MRFQVTRRADDGSFPKPVRVKPKRVSLGKAGVSHNTVLDECIRAAEEVGYGVLHVPDEVYALCSPAPGDDPLTRAIGAVMGFAAAKAVKASIASQIKGVCDLFVFRPVGNGINLCLAGDIKVGADHLNAGQRRFGKLVSIKTWSTADEFVADLKHLVSFKVPGAS